MFLNLESRDEEKNEEMMCERENTHTPLSHERRLRKREKKKGREGEDKSPPPRRVAHARTCAREQRGETVLSSGIFPSLVLRRREGGRVRDMRAARQREIAKERESNREREIDREIERERERGERV